MKPLSSAFLGVVCAAIGMSGLSTLSAVAQSSAVKPVAMNQKQAIDPKILLSSNRSSVSSASAGTARSNAQAAQPAATTLHNFLGGAIDGFAPYTGLIQASDGNFYGTTQDGGSGSGGTIFELTPSGQYTLIYSFTNGADGGQPYSSLIEATDGYLYGTTSLHGGANGGTLFKINLQNHKLITLLSFPEEGFPIGNLIDDGAGTLYGTTFDGGKYENGSVYSWNYEQRTFHTLYSFTGGADGEKPQGGVVLASDGKLYGTARFGGAYNDTGLGDGTAFVLNTDGTGFAAFYDFSNGVTQADGYAPTQSLVQGSDGNLYGTTNGGNSAGGGSYFKIVPSGASSTLIALHAFNTGNGEGANVYLGAPLIAGDGHIYVVGSGGGANSEGQVMEMDAAGNPTDLYDFGTTADSNAGTPYGGIIEGQDGSLYGTTENGGAYSGTVYKLATAVAPGMTLTASPATAYVGGTVTLNWAVTNAFSPSASVCVARSTDGTFGGNGSTGIREISGTEQVTTVVKGTVTYTLTCGGVETASATVTVVTTPTVTTLTGAATASIQYGQSATVNTKVTPQAGSDVATGSIELLHGSRVIATSSLSAGTGMLTVPAEALAPGTYLLPVSYMGSVAYSASASSPFTLTVNPLVPTVNLQVDPSSLVQGQPTVITVAVSNGGITTPSGVVTFKAGGRLITRATLIDGSATVTFDSTAYSAGGYSVTATYEGDIYNTSASQTQAIELSKAATVTLLSGPASVAVNAAATYTVTVSRPNLEGYATGTVNVLIGTKVVRSVRLLAGPTPAIVSFSGLAAGRYSLSAQYVGDANNNGSVSSPVTVTVVDK